MARGAAAHSGGAAGRLAASRRARWNGRDDDSSSSRSKSGSSGKRPKKSRGEPSGLARIIKLAALLAFMATLGFVVVLVVDVSATVLGQVKLGEVTVTEVWAKVVDRVLDRDVPAAPRPVARPSARPVQPAPIAPASASSRAPLPAPRPDEYDKHVQPAADPDVEAARKRLDELLKRL